MKSKLELDVFAMCGIIFSIVGTCLTGVGLWFALNQEWVRENATGDTWLMAPVFLGMGLLVLIVGLLQIIGWVRRMRKRRMVIEKGFYIWGTIESLHADWSQQINNRPTMFPVVTAEYNGVVHTFEGPRKSYHYVFPEVGSSVRVYIDQDDIRTYAVVSRDGTPF